MKLKFGLRRLLAAIVALAAPFGLLSLEGEWRVLLACVVSICLGTIVLVVKRSQLRTLTQVVIFGVLGIAFGFALSPSVFHPYRAGDEFGFMIAGCLIGCIVGIALNPEKN